MLTTMPLIIPMTEDKDTGAWKAVVTIGHVTVHFTQRTDGLNEVLLMASYPQDCVPCDDAGICPYGCLIKSMTEDQMEACVQACPQKVVEEYIGDSLMLWGSESFEQLRLEALASVSCVVPAYHPALIRPWLLCDC